MKFIRKWGLALVPVLALATPALALAPADQADSSQPGSVIIFPKFINMPAVTVDGVLMPRTEIEVGVVCPVGATCVERDRASIAVVVLEAPSTSNLRLETRIARTVHWPVLPQEP